jgi:hypothetical protein
MAGDWLKMRHDLADDPAVIRLAMMSGLEDDAVIGRLFRLWAWVDRHSKDGQVEGLDLAWVDRLARREGFGAALVRVGWLLETVEGLCFPRFDRHCSDSAKARALGKNRVEAHRNGAGVTAASAPVTVPALPEKRREEIHPPPRESFAPEAWQALRKAWNAGLGKPWRMANPPPPAVERLAEPDWIAAYPTGIAKLSRVRYFRTPVSLRQFCGNDPQKGRFLDRLIGGEFDDVSTTKRNGDFGGSPSPPRVWTGEIAEAFERTRRKLASMKEQP